MLRRPSVVALLCPSVFVLAALPMQAHAAPAADTQNPASHSGLPPDVVDRSEGLRREGELAFKGKTMPVTFKFDTPDRYGAQGTYRSGPEKDSFYGCRPSTPTALLCKVDAGRITLPMKMKFSSDMKKLSGSFDSPFENGPSMAFTTSCKPQ